MSKRKAAEVEHGLCPSRSPLVDFRNAVKKRRTTRPRTRDDAFAGNRSSHSQQLDESNTHPQQWLPPSPQSSSRRRQDSPGKCSSYTHPPSLPTNCHHWPPLKKQKLGKDQVLQEQRAWQSVEDWIQIKPEQIAILEANPRSTTLCTASMADAGSQGVKRSSSTSSSKRYSQSVRDGELPRAHSIQHENNMRKYGMFMGTIPSATVAKTSLDLCDELLSRRVALPSWFVGRDVFLEMLQTFRCRNEASIVKTITRFVMPSPEMLSIEGYKRFEDITESNNALWDKCAVIHGTAPKPDIALGIKESAFSDIEQAKLHVHCTIDTPTRFSEEMHFPFLICEVKSNNVAIQEAERQAMHSASIAVRAIVELFRRNGDEKTLDGRILVFSISQNHDTVKVFGHFPHFSDDQLTFHRRVFLEVNLESNASEDEWTRPYQFGLAICERYFPIHLGLIRDALQKLKDPSIESFTARVELSDSQDAVSSSQESYSSKRARTQSSSVQQTALLREEITKLTGQLVQQREESRQREERHDAESERLFKQLEQQRQESKEQLEQQRQESKEQLEQQRQESKEQLEQQRQESKEQLERLLNQLEQQRQESQRMIELLMRTKA